MSYLEILLLLTSIISPFYISLKQDTNLNNQLGILSAIILIVHLVIDGFRWQMIPIYFLSLILIICLFNNWKYFKGNWFRKITSGLFLFLFLGLGFSLSTILPIFELPIPSGEYEVGSEYFHLKTDEDEFITEDKTDKRELMIKVWYPANIKDETKEPYLNDGDRVGFANKYGLPQNAFNYLKKMETHTFQSPEIADGKFPVLVFSHGYYSKANGYYALIEEIVSQGFVVFGINHTYESVGSLFPSNETKFYSKEYDRKHNNEEMVSMIWEAMEIYKSSTDQNQKSKTINNVLKKYLAAEINNRWSTDFDLVINQISIWEESTFLSNHLDLSKIGVFGHSQGGAASAETLLNNSKVSAGINIDGVQWGNMVDTFLTKPFLLISSDWPEDHPNFNKYAYQNGSIDDFYLARIKDTGHSNFMDIPFMINLKMINEAGAIDPKKAIEITSKMVVDFFDKYLNNEKTNLLELSNQYPELEIMKNDFK